MLRQTICSKKELVELLTRDRQILDSFSLNNARNYPDWFYETIIDQTIPFFDKEHADLEQLVYEILIHRQKLNKQLGRTPNFTTAALDLLDKQNQLPKTITVIETTQLQQIISRTKEDAKTGCYNESFFRQLTTEEIKRAERYDQKMSIIMIDIDNFKQVNDTHGHLNADKLLLAFANILKENVRIEDHVGRFGGDEFIILLPQTGRVGARCLAERIRATLQERICGSLTTYKKQQITFSGGIATYPQDGECYEQLINQADKKLYQSKANGKNCIHDILEDIAQEHSPSLSQNEKRRHMRYKILQDGLVDVHNHDLNIPITGKIINISESGILLECNCQLPDKITLEKLELTIKKLGHEKPKDFHLPGDVVRINKSYDNLKFFLAIKFASKLNNDEWNLFRRHTDLIYA